MMKALQKRLLALALAAVMLLGAFGYTGTALFFSKGMRAEALSPTDMSQSDSSGSDSTTPRQSAASESDTTTSSTKADASAFDGEVVECRGHKYQYVQRDLSWEEAEAWCAGQGGYLATIGSQYENDFVAKYLSQTGNRAAYIGLSGTTGQDFAWGNGEQLSYVNWAARQPILTNSAVYGMYTRGSAEWSTASATERPIGFVIEWGPKAPLPNSDDKSPNSSAVIIIPGMGGSVIKKKNGSILWDTNNQDITALRLEDGVSRSDLVPGGGDNPIYADMVSQAQDICSSSDICLFQWDWRNRPALAAGELATLINTKGWNKVTLIGHDVGGLVACDYMDKNGGSKVDKLIALGTPFYGSTRAVYTMMTGMFCDGFSSCTGEQNTAAATFDSLASIIPGSKAEKLAGYQSITGALTDTMPNSDLRTLLNISVTSECDSLNGFYEKIGTEYADKLFVVASCGVPTISGMALTDDSSAIRKLYPTLMGDGSSLLSSTAPDFGGRQPYILDSVGWGELASDEKTLKLVGNLLKNLGDTASYDEGCEGVVVRELPAVNGSIYTVTASGACGLSVNSEAGGITLNNTTYSAGGAGHAGYVCANNVKTVFTTTKNALVSVEIFGNDAMLEIKSGGKGALRWSKLPDASGTLLSTRIDEPGILRSQSADEDGLVASIAADKWSPAPEAEPEEKSGGGYKPNWYDAGALLCFIAAAALCFIGIPMCAFGLTKIEIMQRREMKRRAALAKKQRQLMEKYGVYQPVTYINDPNNMRRM